MSDPAARRGSPSGPTTPGGGGEACGFRPVLGQELVELGAVEKPVPEEKVFEEALKAGLTGLAFSGGGIRSATFNLGVLEALARLNLLEKFHYLSTVSGGGYIGTWLSAWMARRAAGSDARPEGEPATREERIRRGREARASVTEALGERPEGPVIQHLRKYSNYLTPRASLASLDTWAFVNSYLRNFLLNLVVLALTVVGCFSLLHSLLLLFEWLRRGDDPFPLYWAAAGLLMLAMLLAFLDIFRSPIPRRTASGVAEPGGGTRWVQAWVLGPLVIAAFVLAAAISKPNRPVEWEHAWIWMAAGSLFAAPWILTSFLTFALRMLQVAKSAAGASGKIPGKLKSHQVMGITSRLIDSGARRSSEFGDRVYGADAGRGSGGWKLAHQVYGPASVIISALVVGWLGGLALMLLSRALQGMPGALPHAFGPLLVLLMFQVAGKLLVGLSGGGFSTYAREWWGRLGGALWLWILPGAFFFLILLYSRLALLSLEGLSYSAEALGAVWALISSLGAFLARGSGAEGAGAGLPRRIITAIAPAVFVIGLLVAGALLSSAILPPLTSSLPVSMAGARTIPRIGFADQPAAGASPLLAGIHPRETGGQYPYWSRPERPLDGRILWMPGAFLLIAIVLSWRMGLNRFSMHELYRNRLVRCYPGASSRTPRHPFTGFGVDDDSVHMSDLARRCIRPYHLINTTLNLTAGRRLAWQQRMGASFTFTPRHCGFEIPEESLAGRSGKTRKGYRPTEQFAGDPTLGTAMAISGAAASPNMGYHSSRSLAFLMTVFNVRLGWWIANPSEGRWKAYGGPKSGLFYLLNELLGLTTARRKFVYLSDGGHFENLGVYELVRRRCLFIVACDAEEDALARFQGLGNVIEKCRTDFGIEIDINIDELRPEAARGTGSRHCAIGRIYYEGRDSKDSVGTLVYLKASLTGDEPTDVRRYASQNPRFPHQSTADQWFSESQFESYRALGEHIGEEVFRIAARQGGGMPASTEEIFAALRQYWHPASAATAESYTNLTSRCVEIMDRIRTTPELRYLDIQTYPEWSSFAGNQPKAPKVNFWLPEDYEEFRQGFYLCNEMIQLMEDVYLDLDLERSHDHPDNQGWMNYFRRWAGSGVFRVTWAICSGTFGSRFRWFCEQRLNLSGGEVTFEEGHAPGRSAEPIEKQVKKAVSRRQLNFRESAIIASILDAERGSAGHGIASLVLLRFLVWSPERDLDRDRSSGAGVLALPFGFALVDGEGRLAYLRIQDHLRRQGLAREALRALMRKEVVSRTEYRVPPPAQGVEFHKSLFERLFRSVRAEFEER